MSGPTPPPEQQGRQGSDERPSDDELLQRQAELNEQIRLHLESLKGGAK